ncbi:MAG: MCE family protein [Geminicoccaceae bacterium]|nr:MAG: MCE family protein [Geminicoccaceae bacterium]
MRRDPTRIGLARGRTGLFVIVVATLFVVAVLQAGILEPLFRRTVTARVLLPEFALAGLDRGSPVQLFGTQIGQVRELVIRPEQPFYAEIRIDEEVTPFIRADSRVVIRRQFGIAGAAFLDISRGTGAELDWEFAVLQAEAERAPTDSLGELLDEFQVRIFPLIDEATLTVRVAGDLMRDLLDPRASLQTALDQMREITADVQAGRGTIGRLLTDDTLLLGLEDSVELVNQRIAELQPVLANVERITGSVGEAGGELPELVAGVDRTLDALDEAIRAVGRAADAVGGAAASAGQAADDLPLVLVRLGQTLAQLEEFLDSLRRSWLLGGQPTPAPGPQDVRP